MLLIGVAPVPAHVDVAEIVVIGGFLAVLLAIALALHVLTARRNHRDGVSGPSDERLGPVV
jgi:hypothetical protein